MESMAVSSKSALLIIGGQKAWKSAAWLEWLGVIDREDQGPEGDGGMSYAKRKRQRHQRKEQVRENIKVETNELFGRLESIGRLADQKRGIVGRSGVPCAHVVIWHPQILSEEASDVIDSLRSVPCFSFSPTNVGNVHDNTFCKCVPGLCQWLEDVVLESGVTRIVVAGATLTNYVYCMAMSIKRFYADSKHPKRSTIDKRLFPPVTVCVDPTLVGDFAQMQAPLCLECLKRLETNSFIGPKTCEHIAQQSQANSPFATAMERLSQAGILVGENVWDEHAFWTDRRADLESVPAKWHGNAACNETHNHTLERIARLQMGEHDAESRRYEQNMRVMQMKRNNVDKQQAWEMMTKEDQRALAYRASVKLQDLLDKIDNQFAQNVEEKLARLLVKTDE